MAAVFELKPSKLLELMEEMHVLQGLHDCCTVSVPSAIVLNEGAEEFERHCTADCGAMYYHACTFQMDVMDHIMTLCQSFVVVGACRVHG